MQELLVSPKHKLLGVPLNTEGTDPRGLFPDAKPHTFGGNEYLLVPHEETEVFLLRKLGYTVPAPITSGYSWPSRNSRPPFDVQRHTAGMLTMAERAYVLNGMGTGKTKCVLWAWDYLRSVNRIGKLLVVAPLSTLNFTWVREIFDTLEHAKPVVLHGSKAQRLKALSDPDANIFIINHDGVKILEKELIARKDIDAVAIDELAVFRNKSDRTKAMKNVAHSKKWVWGLSGSPMPHAPTDVYHQASIVTPDRVPKYFKQFRDTLMLKITDFKYVPKDDAIENAYAVMQPAVRYTIDEVQELPPCVERWIDVPLGAQQQKVYKDLVSHCQSAVGTGQITAANAGAVMNKLLQVSLGWVYTHEGKTVPLDNKHRIDALMDCIESTDRKVLIFAPFIHALDGLSGKLTEAKYEHAVVSGATPHSERDRVFSLFQNTGKYKVLLAHPQCLAHGITLTAADTIIWAGPVTSLEIYDQANHRIKRVGQKHKQQILHLQSTPVEKKIYKLLATNQATQQSFLRMFEDGNETW